MSIDFKQFVINFYNLPIERNSISLKRADSYKEYLGMTQDPIVIQSDGEDFSYDKLIENDAKLQYNECNQPILVNNQDLRNNTRVIIISCNEYANLYQSNELNKFTARSIDKNEGSKQQEELLPSSKQNLIEPINDVCSSSKICRDFNNKISIKLGGSSKHLMKKVEELSDAVTSCEKLRGHPCSMTHCYNKATKRMNKIITCNYEGCGKQFTKTWNILDHFKIHTGEKPFICEFCGKSFSQNGNLSKHKKLHYEGKYIPNSQEND